MQLYIPFNYILNHNSEGLRVKVSSVAIQLQAIASSTHSPTKRLCFDPRTRNCQLRHKGEVY